MVDARTATSADFERVGEKHARAFWLWLIAAGIVWWLASIWWAAIPCALAALCAVQSIGCTLQADRIRKGAYRVPNVNNGAPDGDAVNWETAE